MVCSTSCLVVLSVAAVLIRCVVCQCEFEGGDEVLKLLPGCGHVYHEACIDQWLSASKVRARGLAWTRSQGGRPPGELSGQPLNPRAVVLQLGVCCIALP